MLDVALALIKVNINTMPSITILLKLLEEEPKSIDQDIKSDMVEYYCMKLRAILAKSTQDEFNTPTLRAQTYYRHKAEIKRKNVRSQTVSGETRH